ncbi:sulfate transporter 1.3-like [Nymphaea colorata]|nr:sulfate transporter 1.3-like [Nymphaea colorata]XP_031492496.1 sulfate transporter 1.3-like [Nymphaea colorata]
MDHSQHDERHAEDSVTIKSATSGSMENDQMLLHTVGIPPRKHPLTELKRTIMEMFFADEPLRDFRDHPRSKKVILGMQAVFPILDWGRQYNYKKFVGDLVAGLTIASLAIPQDIGYANLAHLSGQYGLYSSFVPPLIYSVLGSSRDIAIGPVAVVSLLMGSLLQAEIDHKSNPVEYRRLAFTATFFAGVIQAALGFFRLGFLVDFLSHAAVVGFMAGAAVTIALQQLKGLLGINHFTTKTDVVSVMRSVWGSAHHGWNWQTILIGVVFLSFLLTTKHIGKRNKRLFWVAAISPMISVILSTFFVYITRADQRGVKIVGNIEKGINKSSVNQIYFSGRYVAKAFKIGIIAAFVALTEAIAIGRTFAAMKDYSIDGNKEMVALGVMNIAGSLTSCYVATGSFSRSSVNYMAGCQTALSNMVMSFVVLLTLELITPLFHYTPNAILAAIITSAVVGLIDFEAAWTIWKIDKMDFVACLGAFLGVLFMSAEIGLLIAVSISFGRILLHATRPSTALLGHIPGTSMYRRIEQYPDAVRVPGVLVTTIDSAIYFSNSNYVRERILRWLSDEERVNEMEQRRIQFLVIEMSPVIDIDTSGIHAMEELYKSLQKREVQLVLANPGHNVIHKIHESKFNNMIGDDNIFLSVAEAVRTCSSKAKWEV